MKRVAFYAPLKSPDHPVPSGDRKIARAMIKALALAGYEVELASHWRSRDGRGDRDWQQRMIAVSRRLAQRIIRQWNERNYRPDLWFTYHLYYKAPDLIGPEIARHYGIPYILAEASWAGKRAQGPWQDYHKCLERAVLQADRILTINPADLPALTRFLGNTDKCINLPPFIDTDDIHSATQAPCSIRANVPRIITIAMMRSGDKFASYQLLADVAKQLSRDFQWFIVGDGPCREAVASLFAGDSRFVFTGQLETAEIYALLAQCELHVWPAVNEAFGINLLEAQLNMVAILSGNEGGVAHVMADGVTGELVEPRNPQALAKALQALLNDPARLQRYRDQARIYVQQRHSLTQAASSLQQLLSSLDLEDSDA